MLEQGLKYLTDRHDEMFADESENSPLLDPSTIDWQAVKDGRLTLRFNLVMTNAPGAASYPISTFTWMLIPSQIPDAGKGGAIKAFLKWMITDGQKDAEKLSYAPLPATVVAKEQKQIDLIK